MKTSNKIFIGLLSTIFLIMSVMFIDIRVFGLHGDERYTKKFTEEFPLENFSHVVVENSNSIRLSGAEKSHILFESFGDSVKYDLQHKVVGDTLFIKGSKSTGYFVCTLFAGGSLQSITLRNAQMDISKIKSDSIFIDLLDAEMNAFRNEPEEASHFTFLSVKQINSRMQFYNVSTDVLNIEMQKSKVRFDKEINHVSAKIYTDSELNLRDAEKLELDKDASSNIRFY